MSDEWPNKGDEFARVDLGHGFQFVIEDDGYGDPDLNAYVENPVGGKKTPESGIRLLRTYDKIDEEEFAALLDDAFGSGTKRDKNRGPPPVSTLPITFCCAGCSQFCVRTRLTNPREPEDDWECEGCAGEDSPYTSLR